MQATSARTASAPHTVTTKGAPRQADTRTTRHQTQPAGGPPARGRPRMDTLNRTQPHQHGLNRTPGCSSKLPRPIKSRTEATGGAGQSTPVHSRLRRKGVAAKLRACRAFVPIHCLVSSLLFACHQHLRDFLTPHTVPRVPRVPVHCVSRCLSACLLVLAAHRHVVRWSPQLRLQGPGQRPQFP